MNFAVCQDPNAGARAAARERNNQKIANYKQNAVKYWNKETSFAKNRKFISSMGYSRDYSDLQESIEAARGKALKTTEANVREAYQRAYVDEGGGARTKGRANRLMNLYSKQAEVDSSWAKVGRVSDKALRGLDLKVANLQQKNRADLGLPPTFGPPTMMPPRDTMGMILSGVQTGLSIYSGGVTAGLWGGDSDLRLKRDVDIVGTSPEGYKIYEYSYAGNPVKRFRGAMAQDVMKKNPMAVHVNPRGFFHVDYNEIDVEFEELN